MFSVFSVSYNKGKLECKGKLYECFYNLGNSMQVSHNGEIGGYFNFLTEKPNAYFLILQFNENFIKLDYKIETYV